MANEREMKRFNIRCGVDLYEFYREQAEEIGVPVSSYIVMILNQNRQMTNSIKIAQDVNFKQMLSQQLQLESKRSGS